MNNSKRSILSNRKVRSQKKSINSYWINNFKYNNRYRVFTNNNDKDDNDLEDDGTTNRYFKKNNRLKKAYQNKKYINI